MNIAVIYKWTRDPDDAFVNDDASVTWRRGRLVASDDDAAAIACARKAAEATGGTLSAVTLGDGEANWALARGASKAYSANDLEPGLNEAATAAKLAETLKHAGSFDLVVMGGTQAYAGVAPVMAALLGLPFVGGLSEFFVDPDDGSAVYAKRMTEQGEETLLVNGPAVLAIEAIETERDVPSIKQMLAARKLPVENVEVPAADLPSEENLRVASSELPVKRKAKIFEGDAESAAGELVAELRAKNIL